MTMKKIRVVEDDPQVSISRSRESSSAATKNGWRFSIPAYEVGGHRRTSRQEPRRWQVRDGTRNHATDGGVITSQPSSTSEKSNSARSSIVKPPLPHERGQAERDDDADHLPPKVEIIADSIFPAQVRRRSQNQSNRKGLIPSVHVDDGKMSFSRGSLRSSTTFHVVRHLASRQAHEEDDDDDPEDGESDGHIEADEGDGHGVEHDASQGDVPDNSEGTDSASSGATSSGSDESQVDPTGESHQEESKGIPTSSTSPGTTVDGSHAKSVCDGIMCRAGSAVGSHIILSSVAAVVLALLCYWRLKSCCSRRHVTHGEYRMVTAQYVDSAFDDNVSDDGSDDENADGGWSKRGRRSIEMHSIDKETNGGLTLEEMNG